MDLPARITFLRKSLRLTQAQLGELVNVSQRSVASWEAGQRSPSIPTLCDLADKLDVSVDYLLGRTEEKQINKKRPAAACGEPSRNEVINLILSHSDQEFDVLAVFLQGMSAGKGIAVRAQAAQDQDPQQSE